MAIDFSRLATIHRKACKAQVAWALHYAESTGTWYFSISSAAPAEEWTGREHGFPLACEAVEEWLDRVLSGWNVEKGDWNA